ncbi:MAG: ribosomal RNA small subunit methyltransferase A [Acidobacteria bacterium]|nr:ribosomal RNA small subunit methyltransferase A [Acidobacteriota bacterium]
MNHRPKRSLGQNFLRDVGVVRRIVDAVGLNPGERVVEIGPGEGALTSILLERRADVTAVEFDRELVLFLQRKFGGRVTVIEADALSVDLSSLVGASPVKLAANLPYNISTPILQRLIDHRDLFSSLVLMFQREVAKRITAMSGTRDRGYLTVISEMAFDIEYLFDVPPGAFYPVPKVWSAVVRLTPKSTSLDEKQFKELVSRGFTHKRKILANNLGPYYPDLSDMLSVAGLSSKCRAEELSLADWKRLAGLLLK